MCIFYGIYGKTRVNFVPIFNIGAKLLTLQAEQIAVILGRLKMGEAGRGGRRGTPVASSRLARRRLDRGRGAAGFQELTLPRHAQSRIPTIIHALPCIVFADIMDDAEICWPSLFPAPILANRNKLNVYSLRASAHADQA